MKFIKSLIEMESETLRKENEKTEKRDREEKAKGHRGSMDKVNAKTLKPNKEYPAPWKIIKSSEGPVAIHAANNKKVADWLSFSAALKILKEIGQSVNESVICEADDEDSVLVPGIGKFKLSQIKKNVEHKLADLNRVAQEQDSVEKWKKIAWMLKHAAMHEMIKTINNTIKKEK